MWVLLTNNTTRPLRIASYILQQVSTKVTELSCLGNPVTTFSDARMKEGRDNTLGRDPAQQVWPVPQRTLHIHVNGAASHITLWHQRTVPYDLHLCVNMYECPRSESGTYNMDFPNLSMQPLSLYTLRYQKLHVICVISPFANIVYSRHTMKQLSLVGNYGDFYYNNTMIIAVYVMYVEISPCIPELMSAIPMLFQAEMRYTIQQISIMTTELPCLGILVATSSDVRMMEGRQYSLGRALIQRVRLVLRRALLIPVCDDTIGLTLQHHRTVFSDMRLCANMYEHFRLEGRTYNMIYFNISIQPPALCILLYLVLHMIFVILPFAYTLYNRHLMKQHKWFSSKSPVLVYYITQALYDVAIAPPVNPVCEDSEVSYYTNMSVFVCVVYEEITSCIPELMTAISILFQAEVRYAYIEHGNSLLSDVCSVPRESVYHTPDHFSGLTWRLYNDIPLCTPLTVLLWIALDQKFTCCQRKPTLTSQRIIYLYCANVCHLHTHGKRLLSPLTQCQGDTWVLISYKNGLYFLLVEYVICCREERSSHNSAIILYSTQYERYK